MQGLEIKLTGSLEKFQLSEDEKARRIKKVKRLTGNFVSLGPLMINLHFKLPGVNYQKANIELNEVYPAHPHIHLEENRQTIYLQRTLMGYHIC